MTLRSAAWTGAALAAIGIGGLTFTAVAGATGPRLPWTQGQTAVGMMGAWGAGGEAAATGLINNVRLAALVDQGKAGASIDARTDTVSYAGRAATIVALASPHGQPNMTWEIDGLVNPTVVVRSGTPVTVDLVNTDWGYRHGFDLTTTPPPYPRMARM